MDDQHANAEELLRLDPDARIVVQEDALHLFCRRGSSRLAGKRLGELHHRIAPLLDGRFTRAQLLAGTGPKARVVGRYLSGLSEAGALCSGRREDLPRGFPLGVAGVQRLDLSGARIAVSLAGDRVQASVDVQVLFGSPALIEQESLRQLARRGAGTVLLVAGEAPVTALELGRRAMLAKHLLAIERGRARSSGLTVLTLDASRLELARQLDLSPTRPLPSLDWFASQLRIIELAEVVQLPLIVWSGGLAGGTERDFAVGLSDAAIREELSLAVIGPEALRQAIEAGPLTGTPFTAAVAGRISSGKPVQIAAVPRGAVIAHRPRECAQRLLEQWALREQSAPGVQVDLLAMNPLSARMHALQELLRLKTSTCMAQLCAQWEPLYVLRAELSDVARIGLEEAIAETLLRAVASRLPIPQNRTLVCVPSLETPQRVRRRLREVLHRVPHVEWVCGRFKWAGRSICFGTLTA